MKKTHLDDKLHTIRVIPHHQVWIAAHRSIFWPIVASILVIIGLMAGYLAGHKDLDQAYALSEAAGLAQMQISRAADEDRIQTVEQINLKEELDTEKDRNDELAIALDEQQQEIDGMQDSILNALMSNLTDKMVSRSSASVSSYTAEAKNLIELNKKLLAFKKSDLAEKINLTEYESLLTDRLAHLPTLKPVPGSLSGYGYRYHPVYRYYHFHPAVDMSNPSGTTIKAAGAGKVTEATYGRTQGYYVTINHGNGFTTTYMHCKKLNVSVGDVVEKGDKIATVGNTVTSTGSHLHFEVRLYGEPLNPKNMILES